VGARARDYRQEHDRDSRDEQPHAL
jgi:hypothetical protein